MQFRRFRNSDVPALVDLWNLYHQSINERFTAVNLSRFEAAVLDRQTFLADDTLVAIVDGQVQAFAHFPKTDHGATCLASLCWNPQRAEIGFQTLQAVCNNGLDQAGLTINDHCGYVGLATGVGLVGVLQQETQLSSWLEQLGFAVTERWQLRKLSLPQFRVPIDRRLIALRRSAVLQEVPAADGPGSEALAGWGHLEPLRFALKTKTGNILAELTAWIPEFGNVASGAEALIGDWRELPQSLEGSELMLFSESIRELAARRILVVRSALTDVMTERVKLLESLGFQTEIAGVVYQPPAK